ncbi:MAG: nucleotidyltransferase [Kordia sp.]|nr:MAG: nucleotidyltransferase [Kordia sp.]
MKTAILNKLASIEKKKNIEILFACESGSRAWGFASPDSDYDIRFIYKHKTEWYLNLWEKKDTIEFMTAEDLDGSGWDLRKATLLLAKSNASLLGWLFSPVIYRADESFLKEIQTLANENFNPVAGFYHFHSMSKSFLDKVIEEEVSLKSFFYALRTTLCSNWILKNGTIPPVVFAELLVLVDADIKVAIEELVAIKATKNESFQALKNDTLFNYLKDMITKNNLNRNSVLLNKADGESFNEFFLKTVV